MTLYYVKQFNLYYGGTDEYGKLIFCNLRRDAVCFEKQRWAEDKCKELGNNCKIEDREYVMSKTFEPGTRVSELVKNRRSIPRKGKVLNESLDDPGLLLVEWDKRGWIENKNPIVKIAASSLMLEEEADSKLTEYEVAFDRLEQEVAGKIRDAAALIMEASKIATANGESLDQLHDVTEPLVHAMDVAGWNTSSWGC